MNRLSLSILFITLLVSCCASCSEPYVDNGPTEGWTEISAVRDRTTRMLPFTWTLDKYPDAETFKAHTTITLLDLDGPGVVTQFHSSDYGQGDSSKMILRVWYDNEENPSIEMPLMDFLGNIGASTPPYSVLHFSRVRKSHNFRLPMPFRRHIRIEVENTSEDHLFGYMDIQWDMVESIPEETGYLKTAFMSGTFDFPHEELVLCEIDSPGSIVAHWLQLEGDHPACANGQGTCEGNHEIYLDGDTEPTYESLGIEDFYGHSWGFSGLSSDFYSAIVRLEETPQGGTNVAMVRARDADRISFMESCRILLTYRHDLGEPFNYETRKGKAPALQPFVDGFSLEVPYRSCFYYYSRTEH